MFTFSPLQITLARSIQDVQQEIIGTQNQLADGKRTLNAGENGIVTRLSSQASAFDTAVKNINSAQSVISVAATTLKSIASIATELKNLATQGASAGLSNGDRASMSTTFASLWGQLTTLSASASINGNNILDTSDTVSVVYSPDEDAFTMDGIDFTTSIIDVAETATAVDGTSDTFDASSCASIVTEMTSFIDSVSTSQGSLTAYNVALDAMSAGAKGISAGLNSTVDGIQGIDSTALQTKLQSLNNQQSIDYYLVSQMNTASAAVLAIFR